MSADLMSAPSASASSSSSGINPVASSQSSNKWFTWFSNLPIARKQLLALIVCELVPLLGLGIGSTWVLTSSLRSQLLSQSQSELAVTEANYNVKLNQMGFGSRGQSDNPAIIAATKSATASNDVQQILKNEVKARKIEYATLVNKDLKIVANANANRAGQEIPPSGLASFIREAIKEGRQVKATDWIGADELRKEAPPMPQGLGKEALIRYVVTPVKDPDNQQVTGALVFGDVLTSSKAAPIEATQAIFSGGYSSVYLRRPSGEYALVASLEQGEGAKTPQVDVPLPDAKLLTDAAKATGQTVTARQLINQRSYTIAAKALPNRSLETPDGPTAITTDAPPAIVVRGIPEATIERLVWASLGQEGLLLLALSGLLLGWSLLFRRLVVQPIESLTETTQRFAQGDRSMRAAVFSKDEVGQLAIAFNQMADNIAQSESNLASETQRQEQQAKNAQALSNTIVRMRRSLNLDQILQTAIDDVRDLFNADRVVVYQFQPDSVDGTIVAESLTAMGVTVLNQPFSDWLGFTRLEDYQQLTVWALDDREAQSVSLQYRQNLAQVNVLSELVAPIKRHDRLTALVCVQQTTHSRSWQESEQSFLSQLATQIGYALDQSQLLQERQSALQDSEVLKDSLQQQIIQLLGEVQGVARGDLTVRASVVPGNIGTVADFFNSIVENLCKLVVNVQDSAIQVNSLLNQNDQSVRQVADEALQQAEETTRVLESVERMTQSVQQVTDRARHAAEVAQSASSAAQSGEEVMDSSVQSIMKLRTTIEDATKKVKQLGDSSQQIVRIVALINELAVQTDLLAINASLEASRAGEQGRGFAIVASEIGDLASRSAAATREVEKIVGTLQQQTAEVVDVMGRSAVQVVEGAHSVKNSKQSLVHMVHLSTQIDEVVRSIVQAMDKQSHTTRSMTGLIREMTEVSTRTSDSSRQVSEALQKTVHVAEELKRSVETFKIPS